MLRGRWKLPQAAHLTHTNHAGGQVCRRSHVSCLLPSIQMRLRWHGLAGTPIATRLSGRKPSKRAVRDSWRGSSAQRSRLRDAARAMHSSATRPRRSRTPLPPDCHAVAISTPCRGGIRLGASYDSIGATWSGQSPTTFGGGVRTGRLRRPWSRGERPVWPASKPFVS